MVETANTTVAAADASVPNEKAATSTPNAYDAFMATLTASCAAQDGVGMVLVRGIRSTKNDEEEEEEDEEDDMEDEDEDEDQDTSKYTAEQMADLRYVIVTKARGEALERMEKLLLGDQYGDSVLMFNTSFSYHVLDTYDLIKAMLGRTKDWSKKFDLLFGYTHGLKSYETWMEDHEAEWGGQELLRDLAKRWKAVLKKPDAEIGIDAEFTRPGVVCFLEQFKQRVEEIETYGDPAVRFNFQ